jgi:signal transduction histidine kinase/ligand-binding sensor domain-containing protein
MACKFGVDKIPEFSRSIADPVPKPLVFQPSRPLIVKRAPADSIAAPKIRALNLDQLQARPFNLKSFVPLTAAPETLPLDLHKIKDSSFSLLKQPVKKLVLTVSQLSKPVMTVCGIPKLVTGTTSGVLSMGEEEGLPGSAISASYTDQAGLLWLATENGLSLYSGRTLLTYNFLNKTKQGSFFMINGIASDRLGRLWLATSGDGIYMVDLKAQKLYHQASETFSSSILRDHQNKIWISTFLEGLYCIDPDSLTYRNIRRKPEQTQENAILGMQEDKRGNLWMIDYSPFNRGLEVLDANRNLVKKITQKQGLLNDTPIDILVDSAGAIWLSYMRKGLSSIPAAQNSIVNYDTTTGYNGQGWKIAADSRQRIWAVGNDSLTILDSRNHSFKKMQYGARIIKDFRGCLLADNRGNMLLGTVNKGLYIFDANGPMPENLDPSNGLSSSGVWGLLQDKSGLIWIATARGVDLYDPQKKTLRTILFSKDLTLNEARKFCSIDSNRILVVTKFGFTIVNKIKQTISDYSTGGILKTAPFFSAEEDNQQRIWLNGFNGVVIYDLKKNTAELLNKAGGLPSDLVWDICKDRNGQMWIGTDSGLAVIDSNYKNIRLIQAKNGLCFNIVQKILETDDGNIWIATQKGISIIDQTKNTICNLNEKEGLLPDVVYDLVYQQGRMYAGTGNGMVAIYPPAKDKSPNWRFVNYGKRQGFPYNDYNQNTGIGLKNGEIWWGIQPVMTVVTQQPIADTAASGVFLTGMSIMDQLPNFALDTAKNSYLTEKGIRWDSVTVPFAMPYGLKLPYDQNAISFAFSNACLFGRDKIRYQYFLAGADTNWSGLIDRNISKTYFNLGSGAYKFYLRSIDANGNYSGLATCSFNILPPWYKTWWAYILYAVLAAVIVRAYAGFRSKKLLQENMVLEQKVQSRTAELSSSLQELKNTQNQLVQSEKMASLGELTAGIAHEIQNPLNFVNNFAEVSTELLGEMNEELASGNAKGATELALLVQENLEKISQHGKRADSIVKGMLQHSRSSSGQKEPVDLNALVDEYLRLSYHGLRAKDKNFNAMLHTDFDTSLPKVDCIPQDIGRVILNMLTNAFYAVAEKKRKEGADFQPAVWISTKTVGQKVEVIIKDNGYGVPKKVLDKIFQPFFTTKPTGAGTGLGLSLSYDIVKAHGGNITVSSEDGLGAGFTIVLPVTTVNSR